MHNQLSWRFSLLMIALVASLASCTNPPTTTVQPQPTASPADSNPIFIATPVPGEKTPVPILDPQGQTDANASGSGELYFIVNDFQTGQLRLKRIQQECLLSGTECPQPEIVPSYPNTNEMIRPLTWSPDGRFALLPLGEALYRFDPVINEWHPIINASIPELPEWSPNGEWIAFIGTTGNQQDIHLVRPDGSEPHNLTIEQFNNPDEHLAQIFWITDESLGFWHMPPGQPKELLQINTRTREITPLIQMSGFTKDVVSFSPDRQKVAMEIFQDGETRMRITNTDGSNAIEAGSFGQSSIWPMTWSPDSQQVAFAVYTSPENDPLTRVYVLENQAGAAIREVFSAQQVSGLVWGPDGQHLAVQAERSEKSQLFLIDLVSGEVQTLNTGSEEGAMIAGASWRFDH